MELLQIKNIVAGYGEKIILNDINFNLNKGEFVGLLGLNGAGKTTLLKVICGLLKSKSGHCLLNEKDLLKYSEKERAKHISFMPQRHSIIYDTTVLDVVLMGISPYLGIFAYPSKADKNVAYEMLEKIGIEKLANENFLNLSEGQKQLILVARSLMQKSQIMLFDEPNSALDFNNSHLVLSKIREIIKNEEKTGLITLHDPNMALYYCDRIIIVKDGILLADIEMEKSSELSLNQIFKNVYNNIEIISYKDKYLMTKV